jgi:hypothetical protein
MKVKLLKKVRKIVKLYKRNGLYYVETGNYLDDQGKSKREAINYYRVWILKRARDIFKFQPKSQLFKY